VTDEELLLAKKFTVVKVDLKVI